LVVCAHAIATAAYSRSADADTSSCKLSELRGPLTCTVQQQHFFARCSLAATMAVTGAQRACGARRLTAPAQRSHAVPTVHTRQPQAHAAPPRAAAASPRSASTAARKRALTAGARVPSRRLRAGEGDEFAALADGGPIEGMGPVITGVTPEDAELLDEILSAGAWDDVQQMVRLPRGAESRACMPQHRLAVGQLQAQETMR
jgi:hypothetical protein